jgi:hypothetical protein
MNDLEQMARPWLTSMIQGRRRLLSEEGAVAVATWAVKTAMMAELTDVASQAHHAEQHRAFHHDRVPSASTRVWVGCLTDTEDWGIRSQHYGCLYGVGLDIELPCNTHQTTLGLNHLLLVVIGSTAEGFRIPSLEEIAPLVPLWPAQPETSWPPQAKIGDAGAWLISTALSDMFETGVRADPVATPGSTGPLLFSERTSTGPTDDLYHACHSCGHSMYWSDQVFAYTARESLCPWCGGDSGSAPPPDDANVLVDTRIGLRGYRDPRLSSAPEDGAWVTIHHLADDSCCRGAAPAGAVLPDRRPM